MFICAKQPVLLPAFEKLVSSAEEREVLKNMLQTFSAEALLQALTSGDLVLNLKTEENGVKAYTLKMGVHVALD